MSRRLLDLLRNKFLKDTATLQVSGLINQASQLISSAVIAFLLGAEGQGALGVAVMLQGLFYNLVSVGVIQAAVGQVASATARGMQGKVAAWMAFVAKTYVLFNTLLIVGGFFVLPRIGAAWYGSEDLGWWAWWLTLWPLVDTPRAVVVVALQGTRRMLPLAQLETAQELGRVFLVTAGAVITGTPEGAIVGEIISRLLAMFVGLEIYREAHADGGSYLPPLREVLRHVPEIPMRQGIAVAIRLGIVKNLSSIFLRVLPRLLIGGTAGLSWVAYFQIAQRIIDIPMMLLQGVSRTMLPALAERHGLKDLAGFRRLFVRTTWIAGSTIAIGILCVLALIPWICRHFYPDDYARPVFLSASILALGYIPMAFAVGLESFYLATNQVRANVVLALAGCAVTIPVNVYLVQHLPETGPLWGLSFYMSWVFVHFAYVAWWFRRASRTDLIP